tara:strand:+ start:181 stop:1392 length:1212 start_codon:yes stop_codon:yes gene_type:complete
MNYYASTTWTHETIERLEMELSKVESMLEYWETEYKDIAFGQLAHLNWANWSYKEWLSIYLSKGWVEVPEYMCVYNPVSFNIQKETFIHTGLFRKKSIKYTEEPPKQWKSFYYDEAIYWVLNAWKDYHRLWKFRLNKLERARFDLRRVKQTPKISIEEALFVCLGLSPAVIGDIGFTKNGSTHYNPKLSKTIGHSKFTLEDTACEMKEELYRDIDGNQITIKSGIYDDNGYGMMEDYLRTTEHYHLIDENEQFKCVSGRIKTKPFLNWAYKHKYLRQYEIKYRDKDNSPYGEKFARVLFDQLTRDGIISGNFDELWRWNEAFGWNSLHYLADEIKKTELIPNKIPYHFKAIEQYIDYTADTELKDQYEPTPENEFEKKRYSEKFELIGRSLTQVELKLEEKEK